MLRVQDPLLPNLMIVAYKNDEYRNIRVFTLGSSATLGGADALESRLRHPETNVLCQLQQRLLGTWSVTSMVPVNAGLSCTVRTPGEKDPTTTAMERESCRSKSDIVREMGLPKTSVLEVLLDNHLNLRNATCSQTIVLYTHYTRNYDVAVSNYVTP